MLWVFMQMAKWACPSWELLHFSPTHKPTRVIRWPRGQVGCWVVVWRSLGVYVCVWGWLLGDSEKSTAWRRSKFRGWRGKRSQQRREYMLEKKVGASRECDFTESRKAGKQRNIQQLLLLTHKHHCPAQCARIYPRT